MSLCCMCTCTPALVESAVYVGKKSQAATLRRRLGGRGRRDGALRGAPKLGERRLQLLLVLRRVAGGGGGIRQDAVRIDVLPHLRCAAAGLSALAATSGAPVRSAQQKAKRRMVQQQRPEGKGGGGVPPA